jgi:hypothetical protein
MVSNNHHVAGKDMCVGFVLCIRVRRPKMGFSKIPMNAKAWVVTITMDGNQRRNKKHAHMTGGKLKDGGQEAQTGVFEDPIECQSPKRGPP